MMTEMPSSPQSIDNPDHTTSSRPVAFIVGASTGLGAALAHVLATNYQLVLLAKSQARLEVLDDQLRDKGIKATLVPFDLARDHDTLDAIVAGIWQRFGRLDLLIGAAATTAEAAPLAHLEPKEFLRMMTVNCTAHFRLLRACDALLRRAPYGQVLMIGGRMQHNDEANAFTAAFDASKAALQQMTQSYARELGHTLLRTSVVIPHPFTSRIRKIVYPGQPEELLSRDTIQAAQIADIIADSNWPNGSTWHLKA